LSELAKQSKEHLRAAEALDVRLAMHREEVMDAADLHHERFDEQGLTASFSEIPTTDQKSDIGLSISRSIGAPSSEGAQPEEQELAPSHSISSQRVNLGRQGTTAQLQELTAIVERLHAQGVSVPGHGDVAGFSADEEFAAEASTLRYRISFVQRCVMLHWIGVVLPLLSSSFVGVARLHLQAYFPCSAVAFGKQPYSKPTYNSTFEWTSLLVLNCCSTIGLLWLFVTRRMRLPHDAAEIFIKQAISNPWLIAACYLWCAHASMDEVLTEYVFKF